MRVWKIFTINNPALYSVLDEFEKNTKRFSNDDVKFISISVDPTEKDTLHKVLF